MSTISVIVPVFNGASTISACVESILSQTIPVQLIVIDGNSSDGTLEQINRYRDSIEIICEPDLGVYDAMNKGLLRATSNFVLFLGADDVLAHPTALENILSGNDNADLILGRVRQMPPRHKRVPEWYVPKWNVGLYFRNTVHHQGVVYKRTILNVPAFDLRWKILADYALHLSLFLRQVDYKITDVHLTDCGSEGISKNFTASLYFEEWRMKRSLLPFPFGAFHLIWLPLKYLYKKF